MIVIGIDPSLTGTGIRATGHDPSTITSKPSDGTLEGRRLRLRQILTTIGESIDDYFPARPDLVVIEAPSLAQKSQAGTLDRNGLWWLIVDRLHSLDLAVVEVTPSTLKKFATGKGNATKPDMRMALFQRAGIDNRDDNQVDAWWLCELGHHLLDEPTLQLPQSHTDALAKVAWPSDVRGGGLAREAAL